MKVRICAGLFLCSLFFVVGGDAQGPNFRVGGGTPFSGYIRSDDGEKPVWTLEFIKVTPENLGPALGYLDDHWMRLRAEAKRQGAVLDYHLMSNGGIVTPGHKLSDQDSIVMVTKYKNVRAFMKNQERLALMPEPNGRQTAPGVVRLLSPEVLFATLNTQVFVEELDTGTGFKLLTKQ